ncbi:alpha/beta fold hydrolase [Planomicrobium sp. YIM 101495]|uniref:alpha/beta fold hydrolase n=1 Tax=Planomicrobium sp. YIM 101495 TaxID=2665160 RepID=UPI00351A3C3C
MTNNRFIEVAPGVELFVRDIGSGDPLVLIPGWTFGAAAFNHQIEHFSKTHRVIAIDPRSQGKSTVSLQGNDYVTHGKDLAKVIETLALENITLLGWSFGCLTVWEYVRQHGLDKIQSAVLVDLSPKPLSTDDENDWVEGPLDDIAGAYTSSLRNPAGQRSFITEYATEVMVQRKLEADELAWIVDESLNTPYYVAANLFAAGMFSDYRVEAKLLNEALPVLTVAAEHWGKTAHAFMERIAPGSQFEVFGGHLMFWEHSKKFNEVLEGFLEEN